MRVNEFRLVRDPNSSTGITALIVMRNIRLRGPLDKGRYVVANRTFVANRYVNFGKEKKKPRITLAIDWKPSSVQWKTILYNKRLERARQMSPMLK